MKTLAFVQQQWQCASTDTSKHYITLIVFVKSWGFPPLQTNASYTDTPQMCECNLAFLYILNAAVGLSLCVSLQKSQAITTYLYCVTRKRE